MTFNNMPNNTPGNVPGNMSSTQVSRAVGEVGGVPGYEKELGVWRRSPYTLGFWWRSIFTFGLYTAILWNRNTITVTSRRVTQRLGGIIGGQEVTINVEKITDISLNQPAMGAIFGYGTIRIQSAGSEGNDIRFDGLGKVRELRNLLFQLQDQYGVQHPPR